jgi:hypothetical protein
MKDQLLLTVMYCQAKIDNYKTGYDTELSKLRESWDMNKFPFPEKP